MHCKKMENLISAYANQECSPEENEQVTSHLASCAACRKMVLEYQKLKSTVQIIPPTPLPDEVINPFYRDTLQKVHHSDQPIVSLNRRLAFKPVFGFALLILLVMSLGIIYRTWKSVPELEIRDNMTRTEMMKLESQFRDEHIRSKWMDQPIPLNSWIDLLTEMNRLQQRHGMVVPILKENFEQILADAHGFKVGMMDNLTLNQSIDYLKRIRTVQSEITLRELANYYMHVYKT